MSTTENGILNRLAEGTYILPHADGFRADLPPALLTDLVAAARKYDAAHNHFDKQTLAFGNLQAGASDRSDRLQAAATADVDTLVDLFTTTGKRPELPRYAGDALTMEYSRLLRAIADLGANRLPLATRRAVRAQGQRLIAGARILADVARQREVWTGMLLGPAIEFEGAAQLLTRDNGAPITGTERLRKVAGEMLVAGIELTRRVDEAERGGGADPGFHQDAYERFDWFFRELQPLIQETGTSEE